MKGFERAFRRLAGSLITGWALFVVTVGFSGNVPITKLVGAAVIPSLILLGISEGILWVIRGFKA